jgi:hypothetical protein
MFVPSLTVGFCPGRAITGPPAEQKRHEGPSFNSHDRQVVVTVLFMIGEVRRTGTNQSALLGLNCFVVSLTPT